MKWRRATDYHGSRSYTEAPPVGMFNLTLAWFTNIARTKLRNLSRGRPGSPQVLLHDGDRNFSLLGAKLRGDAGDGRVPVKPRTSDRRDWRVLP
jgi:hypothetical protein